MFFTCTEWKFRDTAEGTVAKDALVRSKTSAPTNPLMIREAECFRGWGGGGQRGGGDKKTKNAAKDD